MWTFDQFKGYLAFHDKTVYNPSVLNLDQCLLLFMNVMCIIMHYFGKVNVI